MALPLLVPLVEETTSTTGTGTFSLAGATDNNRTFVTGVGDGGKCYYYAQNGASEWEEGIGTVTDADPDTLSRDTILRSSNAGSAVNFTSSPTVRIDVPSLMAAPPTAKVSRSTNQTFTTSTAEKVVWEVEDWDSDGLVDLATNNDRVTIKQPGIYVVAVQGQWEPSGIGYCMIRVAHRNSAGTQQSSYSKKQPDSNGFDPFAVTYLIGITDIDDYLELELTQGSGGDLDLTGINMTVLLQRLATP